MYHCRSAVRIHWLSFSLEFEWNACFSNEILRLLCSYSILYFIANWKLFTLLYKKRIPIEIILYVFLYKGKTTVYWCTSLTLVLISQWSLMCPFLRVSKREFNRYNWVYCCYINPVLYSALTAAHAAFILSEAKAEGKLLSADAAPMQLQCVRVFVSIHVAPHKHLF